MGKYKQYTKDYFTDEEKQVLKRNVRKTWNNIASDYLSLGDGPISAVEGVQVCLDADRWRYSDDGEAMPPIMDKLRALGWGTASWAAAAHDIFGEEDWE